MKSTNRVLSIGRMPEEYATDKERPYFITIEIFGKPVSQPCTEEDFFKAMWEMANTKTFEIEVIISADIQKGTP